MSENVKIGVLGGDRRMLSAVRVLSEKYECAVWGFSSVYGGEDEKYLKNTVRCVDADSAVRASDAVLLPLPASRDGEHVLSPLESSSSSAGGGVRLGDIPPKMKKDALLLGGMIPPIHKRIAAEYGIKTVDYYDSEAFQILNTIPTAEGAIAACMNVLPITIAGMRCVVVGYGRVARTLAMRLISLGASVYAAARSERDLSWARCDGCVPVELGEFRRAPVVCDAVFNTVPALIFDEELLGRLSPRCVIFELASGCAGIDGSAAEKIGIKTVPLMSLPGKTSPESAGEIISSSVSDIIGRYLSGRREL